MKHTLLFAALSLILSAQLQANDKAIDAIKQALSRVIPSETPDSIIASPVADLFEVSYSTTTYYVSHDGHFLFQGDLIDLNTGNNLTEQKRADSRVQLLKSINSADTITFSPTEKRHTVTVFTDIDCTYCRKMHREVKSYTDLGIEIRYLAYPRSGPNTRSYFKAVSVWCSDDKPAALTIAKSGADFDIKTCADNPVDQHMALGEKIGVSGTPALVFDDGTLIPGYLNADRLSQYLDATPTQD